MKYLLGGAASMLLASAVVAQGQAIQVAPVYTGYYTDNTLSTFVPTIVPVNGPGFVHRVDVQMTLSGLTAGQDFWVTFFDVNAGAGLTPLFSGWNPVTGQYDRVPPPGDDTNFYSSQNSDAGGNPSDMQEIWVEAGAPDAANRQYGELGRPADTVGYPSRLGTIYLEWNGSATSLSTSPIVAAAPWGIYSGNASGTGTQVGQSGSSFTGGTVNFVPEPSIVGVGALASMAFLSRRRVR